eukprot:141801_1
MGNNEAKMANMQLSEHVKISISDTIQARADLRQTWRKFYTPWISSYSKNRKKFVAIGSLCNSLKVSKVTNVKKEIWLEDNQKQCDSMYVQFDVYIDIKHKKQNLNIKLSTLFDEKYDLFDDNKFDKYNKYWQHSIGLINTNIKQLWIPFLNQIFSLNDKISIIIYDYLHYININDNESESNDEITQEIIIMDNDKIYKNYCELMSGIFNFDNETSEIISIYFDLLWKWFTSKQLIHFRKETSDERMVWRESVDMTGNSSPYYD